MNALTEIVPSFFRLTIPFEDIYTIIASHDYHPCGCIARGAAEIERYLSQCIEPLYQIRNESLANPSLDDQALADRHNRFSGLPTVGRHVFIAVRSASLP